jgi:hypothetical protein
MVNTTTPSSSRESPTPQGKAGAPEIEVTPDMIEAGVRVLWESGVVETPIDGVDQMVIQRIFVAMSLASKERS